MGCCLSTTTNNHSPSLTPRALNSTTNRKCSRRKHPLPSSQPLLEEETVKEVLSETPIATKHAPSPAIRKLQEDHRKEASFIMADPFLSEFSSILDNKRQNEPVFKKPFMVFNHEEISEQGLGKNVSASTTFTESGGKNDSNAEDVVKDCRQKSPVKFKNRTFSGELKLDKGLKKSPVRRPEAYPVRVGSGPSLRRRDSGENSGRRSRSPVTRTGIGHAKPGLDGSESSRRTGKSPGRVGSGLGERYRRPVVARDRAPTTNESLENPLVSLECFIFL